MLQLNSCDDFVLASGKTSSVRDFVIKAAECLDFELEWEGEQLNEKAFIKSTGKQILGIDEKFYRPSEVDIPLGNPSKAKNIFCLLYTSPSPRDRSLSRMPSSA